MNLPFQIPAYKDVVGKRKEEATDIAARYEHKLAEYSNILESYKRCVLQYSRKLDSYESRSVDNQLTIVQTAMDLTYLKEQGEKTIEMIENLKSDSINKPMANLDMITNAITDTSLKIDSLGRCFDDLDKSIGTLDKNVEGLDKNVVNRISELLLELQKQTVYQNKLLNTEVVSAVENLNKRVRKGQLLLWLILIFNLFGVSAIAFLVAYYLELIPFWF